MHNVIKNIIKGKKDILPAAFLNCTQYKQLNQSVPSAPLPLQIQNEKKKRKENGKG